MRTQTPNGNGFMRAGFVLREVLWSAGTLGDAPCPAGEQAFFPSTILPRGRRDRVVDARFLASQFRDFASSVRPEIVSIGSSTP